MVNRVRRSIRTRRAASGRRFCQLALLPAIAKIVGGATALAVDVDVAIALVALVAAIAIFAKDEPRRRSALAVLDRILRWRE